MNLIYKGEVLKDLSFNYISEARYKKELMSSHYLYFRWYSPNYAQIPAGAYVDYKGQRFTLLEPYVPQMRTEVECEYSLILESEVMGFKKHPMLFIDGGIEVINLNKSGLITANPNGTVFLEPVTNVTAYYKDGLDVSSINIVEIEEFSHMVGGVYEPLDVSKVKIEDNKLTHPDAKNGLVYLVYRYDDNPIYGESTISYYNNNRVLESPNGTFFKPVFSVDDEGSITLKGEKL